MSNTKNLKLMDEIRQVMRIKHYSIHTERSYCDWIKQYVKYHKMQDRTALSTDAETKIEDFLSYLAI
jgi:hypothetical protein